MTIGIFYPHPINGSLGSIRRVKEIAATLATELDVQTNIYTPYERDGFLTGKVSIRSISNLSSLRLNDLVYTFSRFVYYNKYLTKSLLTLTAKNSAKLLSKKLVEIMTRDKTKLLQAEHDISLFPAIIAAKQLGIPVIADLHNITAEELISAGVIRKESKIYRKIQGFVGECLSQVDHVCVVSEYMANYVSSNYGIKGKSIIVVPPASRIITSPILDRKPNRVVYSGMVTYREHVDLFVRSMPYVKATRPNVEFFVTDKGDALAKVKWLARKLGAKINFFWFKDEAALFDFLATCTVGVLPSINDEARRLGTPIKLFDYMSFGLPVVANDVGAWSKIVEDEKIGILAEEDPAKLCSAIKTILDNSELRNRMTSNALRAVKEKYNWKTSVRPLVQTYGKLL